MNRSFHAIKHSRRLQRIKIFFVLAQKFYYKSLVVVIYQCYSFPCPNPSIIRSDVKVMLMGMGRIELIRVRISVCIYKQKFYGRSRKETQRSELKNIKKIYH